jgi:HAD superfamily hydrolase (TIGR01509 family)
MLEAVPTAVIIDLDGTLVDTARLRVEAWRAAFADVGMDPPVREVAARIGMDGRQLAREVASLHGHELDASAAAAIDASSGQHFDALNSDPAPLPGADELIAELERRGIPWAIATSSQPEQVKRSLAHLAGAQQAVLIDASRVKVAKPAPDILLAAAEQLHVDPSACWAVGDSVWDVEAARAAGMIAVLVTRGSVADEGDLRGAGASVVVDTLHDVAGLLAR